MDAQVTLTLGTTLIAAVATVVGSAITAYFGFRSVKATADMAKTKEEVITLRKELIATYRQLCAYYQLEDEYIQAIVRVSNGSEQSIKIAHRDKVQENGFERPQVKKSQIEKRVRELEI